MPDFDVTGGLSGAASGAGTGAALGSVVPGIGNAVGAAVGGAVGFLGGAFSGDDEMSPARRRAIQENRQLFEMLQSRYRNIEGRSPSESTFFQAATTQAREQAERQQQRDASQAAARGLGGSQFEVAQAAQRQAELGEQQTQAIGQAAVNQRQREQQALQSMLRQRGNLDQLISGKAKLQAQQELARQQQLQQSLAGLGQTLATMGASGGGG